MASSTESGTLAPTPDEFRDLGYRAVDIIADYFESIDDLPVFPGKAQTEIEAVFEEPLPETGEDPASILEEWPTRVLPNATHVGSPRYFGYVMGSGTAMGVVADALAASINMNAGGWKPAPAATEIERQTISWIAEMIGYPTDCGGQFTSGGTMANLTAILTGLRAKAGYDTKRSGLQSADQSFTLYMSDHEGHSSIYRVAEILGLGSDAVRLVPSHDDFTMDVDALAEQLDEDVSNGDTPLCVVAQVGSVNVGAIDPLDEIATVCAERDIWFHADGACGALGAILPEKRPQYAGLERADSVTLDPHKWLYIPYDCGCVLVRDHSLLADAFEMHASYLEGTMRTPYEGLDYYEVGPQMSRGFRALKVWMSLKHYGVEGYRTLLSQNVHCTEHLDARVRDADDFVALHEPNLYLYSFQYAPPDLQALAADSPQARDAVDTYLDELNQRIADEIQLTGTAFVMTTSIHGRTVLRFSICSHRTTTDDIDRTFEALRDIGEQVDSSLRQTLDRHV
ncbi:MULTISPECIES: aminotransferase class V-fold PLP-dependent enzyme [Haloferax]|uniref:Aminotransferase class V-fold PLP-dependent enzyme n=2 Tax=Haloferax TaxID=2251 RepID=A0A6G1Z1G6_9EURY|nr:MULTISPECIES: aminotransferase class V-fold PLP-dependent enzyme [Haloferax]KAB1187702.1 aminotransferase class V-fold PLP-dependent enzyme [Haloferax sp. CBA1149]MRW80363.1 aminotransferase class V-fold PLP-dependent enzyme [Haloferax marinisediminis]